MLDRREIATVTSRRHRRVLTGTASALLVTLVLASCAAGSASPVDTTTLAGFWQGLWHGLVSPVTLVVSLFTDSVSIYAIHNNGNWYDAGFMIGISAIFSSTARGGAWAQARRPDERRHASQDRA
ncbi:MAG TPA: hypothetical protein VFE45_14535 [Coriobacteriia bacterium]|nr:hypothetical protein [Coriobacteriia bacterium]